MISSCIILAQGDLSFWKSVTLTLCYCLLVHVCMHCPHPIFCPHIKDSANLLPIHWGLSQSFAHTLRTQPIFCPYIEDSANLLPTYWGLNQSFAHTLKTQPIFFPNFEDSAKRLPTHWRQPIFFSHIGDSANLFPTHWGFSQSFSHTLRTRLIFFPHTKDSADSIRKGCLWIFIKLQYSWHCWGLNFVPNRLFGTMKIYGVQVEVFLP